MYVSQHQRQSLYDAYNRLCHICNRPIADIAEMDLDHLTPKAQGGDDTLENLAPTHARCNRGKQAILRHVPKTHQLRLLPTYQPQPTATTIDDPESVVLAYMQRELAKGSQDSGFCQRVIDFARQRIDPSLSNADGMTLYLQLFKQLGLKTKSINGHFMTNYASLDEEETRP